jgi:hypothetical protein
MQHKQQKDRYFHFAGTKDRADRKCILLHLHKPVMLRHLCSNRSHPGEAKEKQHVHEPVELNNKRWQTKVT